MASGKYKVKKLVTFDKGWFTTPPFVLADPKGEVGPTPAARSYLSCNIVPEHISNRTVWEDNQKDGLIVNRCKSASR